MIGPVAILALSLAATPTPAPATVEVRSCFPNPTIPTRPNELPAPLTINCTSGKLDVVFNGWRCDVSSTLVDGHQHRYYDWVMVATPKPPADACNVSTVCDHADGWTCKRFGTKARPVYDWQFDELTELP